MLIAIYSGALFLGAFLLFGVQPLFSKMALPLLGGSPAVWNTAQVFFQSVLFLGYLYAHLLTTYLRLRWQVGVHLTLLAIALVVLPIAIAPDAQPPVLESPITWLIGLLLVTLGAPFFLVTTTAPLLQRWFALSAHPRAKDPYFLYSASNLGGLLALLSYPFLFAPFLGLGRQSVVWSAGYALLAVLIVLISTQLLRTSSIIETGDEPSPPTAPPSLGTRLRWLVYAFVPSSLLLGVTLHVSTDIAPSPVLWIAPLTLFLLTFIFVFARHPPLSHRLMLKLQPVLLVSLVMFFSTGVFALDIALHLATFFVTAMVCHGALAQSRPEARHLTQFFLWMSLGGVLGGFFAGFIAPQIFSTVAEYPLTLVLACLLRPGVIGGQTSAWLKDIGLAVLVGMLFWFSNVHLNSAHQPVLFAVSLGLVGLALYLFRHRPLRLALGVLTVVIPTQLITSNVLAQHRSFFGVHRVLGDASGAYQLLTHGTTIHGAEHREQPRWREPLTYYYNDGPIGQLLKIDTGLTRIGIIGLGTGTLACYFRDTETRVDFFEIDPVVVSLAANPNHFQFLQQCGGKVSVLIGDGRRTLSRNSTFYDLLVLDAFSSDSVPIHLLTREAMALYFERLTPEGALAMHISNRHLDLEPVIKSLVEDAHLSARIQHHTPPTDAELFRWKSSWVVIARDEVTLARLTGENPWTILSGEQTQTWTDDYSNVMGAVKWRRVLSR